MKRPKAPFNYHAYADKVGGEPAMLDTELSQRNDPTGTSTVLPNPDTVLQKAGKTVKDYRDLLTDSQVGGAVFSRKSRTTRLKWWLNTDTASGEGVAELQAELDLLPMRDLVEQFLDAFFYGIQPGEVIWTQRDALIGIDAVKTKPVEWFDYNKAMQLRFKDASGASKAVPDRKFLVAKHGATAENPYGFPIASRCFWPVSFKRGDVEFWATFTEKYGDPMTIIDEPDFKGTPEEIEKKRDDFAKLVYDMVQDAVIITGKGQRADVKQSGGTASVEIYERFAGYMDDQISKGVLSHTGAIDSTAGRLGGEDAAENVLDALAEADKSMIEATFQQLVNWWYQFNFPTATAPRFELYREADINKATAERDAVLAEKIGVKFSPAYIMRTYSLRAGDFTISAPTPAGNPAPSPAPTGSPAFAESDTPPDQRAIDQLADSLTPDQLQTQMEMMLKPVYALVSGAATYSEVLGSLASTFPKMNSADLQAVLTRCIFIAEATGRLSADQSGEA